MNARVLPGFNLCVGTHRIGHAGAQDATPFGTALPEVCETQPEACWAELQMGSRPRFHTACLIEFTLSAFAAQGPSHAGLFQLSVTHI